MKPAQWLMIGTALTMAAAAPTAATTHTLTLTGDLAIATSNTFTIMSGDTLTQTALTLTGFTPFTVVAGDVIDFSISFTGFMFNTPPFDYFVVGPAATGGFGQLFAPNFFNSNGLDPINASNMTTSDVVLTGGVGDLTGLSLAGACSNCLSPILGRGGPGPYGGFGFSGLSGATAVQLDGSYLVDSINLSSQIQFGSAPGGVPEPASWALLIAGFGLTGAVARRRRIRNVTA